MSINPNINVVTVSRVSINGTGSDLILRRVTSEDGSVEWQKQVSVEVSKTTVPSPYAAFSIPLSAVVAASEGLIEPAVEGENRPHSRTNRAFVRGWTTEVSAEEISEGEAGLTQMRENAARMRRLFEEETD